MPLACCCGTRRRTGIAAALTMRLYTMPRPRIIRPSGSRSRRRRRSEERRVGKECRSRCDWSSDVCSSDLNAATHWDRGGADDALIHDAEAAHYQAVRIAKSATTDAVQILGGAGFMQDHPVEMWMRDAAAME